MSKRKKKIHGGKLGLEIYIQGMQYSNTCICNDIYYKLLTVIKRLYMMEFLTPVLNSS